VVWCWNRRAGALGLALALTPAAAAAQSLEQQCADRSFGSTEAQQYCDLVVGAIRLAQPRLGVGLTGGDALPGTASTLGMRMGHMPRIAVDLRITGTTADIPDVRTVNATGRLTVPLGSVAADAAVGLFQGFAPLPTVGGVLSLDVIGSAGIIPIPSTNGFQGATPVTWALGARLGLLRESFTVPGVSISAMYRRVGDVAYGDSTLQRYDAYFASNLGITSVRATVGKTLAVVGITAGAGWDRYHSDVAMGASVGAPIPDVHIPRTSVSASRTSLFADLSLNYVVLSIVAEAGWQLGGTLPAAPLPPGANLNAGKGALFGGLSLRLTI
jgi:hypothetical protein